MRTRVLTTILRRATYVTVLCGCILISAAQGQTESFSLMDDRAFIEYLRAYRHPLASAATATHTPNTSGGKCGFALSAEARRRIGTAPPAVAEEILSLLAPLARQYSILSASGRFRIHYDTAEVEAAALLDERGMRRPGTAHDFARRAADLFDSVYQVMVVDIGYDAPPYEETMASYNVYVKDFGVGGDFGVTWTSFPRPSGTVRPTFTCYIEIDNDYRGYRTAGLAGLAVTAAHEFHHMIQLGSYGLWSTDTWMHEMTSTYYEEALFPSADDYVYYIRDFMKNPERPFWFWQPGGGYELALWPLFLERSYDRRIMQESWSAMRRVEPFTAMRDAIRRRGGDMGTDLCGFARANYFTGYRAKKDPSPVYDDAGLMAAAKSIDQRLTASAASIVNRLAPTGAMYCRFFSGLDTVSFVVANSSVEDAITRSSGGVGFELELRASATDPEFIPLANGWAYRFRAERSNTLCLIVAEGGSGITADRELPFPVPFNPVTDSRLHFPVPRSLESNRADLLIYSPSMDLIARRENQAVELDDLHGPIVSYDARTDHGIPLPSGVYFYLITFGTQSRTGKFAVINH